MEKVNPVIRSSIYHVDESLWQSGLTPEIVFVKYCAQIFQNHMLSILFFLKQGP